MASGGTTLVRFGTSVSIDTNGGRTIVSALFGDGGDGSAYIFECNGTTWTEEQQITASDGVSGDRFGVSVSINSDGCRVIVGANFNDDDKGSAYIFKRIGVVWTEEQKILASDGAVSDNFEISVSINSDSLRVIVGASRYGDDRGSAYIFGNEINRLTLLSFKC